MESRYGGHCSSIPDALTLFEVGGRISSLGHGLGCQVFSQFPTEYLVNTRRGKTIDYVWAVRARDHSDRRRWHVVAAFECEGIDVGGESLANDVEKLSLVANGREIPVAVVLYRTNEDGWLFWRPGKDWQRSQEEWLESATTRVQELCDQRGCTTIPVVLDRELIEPASDQLGLFIAKVKAELAVLASLRTLDNR